VGASAALHDGAAQALAPIGERPILEHLIRRLGESGIARVDVCVGHLGGLIQTYFREGAELPPEVSVELHWEKEPLGTAGALRGVPDLTGSFLVMNGDVLTTLDYRALMDTHVADGALLTVATKAKPVEVILGVIESNNGRITGYRERPTLHYNVSMSIYVYDVRAVAYFPEGPFHFPELVQKLAAAGEHVATYRSNAEVVRHRHVRGVRARRGRGERARLRPVS
jgi:NDP-sugar pyrophosphorylase family protein